MHDASAPDASRLPERGSVPYFTALCLIAALGGFLFGFDTAVISGAIKMICTQFSLDEIMEGWVVSSALVGCIVGAASAGGLSDRFGRKRVLVLSGLLFLFTATGCALAREPAFLTFARLAGGIAVGVAGMVVPLYIAEISPPALRGRMISCFQLAITMGILAAYFSNALLGELSARGPLGLGPFYEWIVVREPWRAMLGSLLFPAGAFFVLLLFVPESPRWLVQRNRPAEALSVLARIGGRATGLRQLDEISQTIAAEGQSVVRVFAPALRWPLAMAIFLAVSSQVSGINAVIYYGPKIFENGGFQFGSALSGQVILGLVNVVFTLLAMWKVDTMGRRALLFVGNAGVFLALLLLSGFFAAGAPQSPWLIVFLCGYLACFAFSLGPLPWVFMAEVFPTRVRGRAMSVANLSLWSANVVVCQTFPWLDKKVGPATTFALYAAMIFPVFAFVAWLMPETKGRSLEELEKGLSQAR
jgi:SP family arabinose:H+ symporter-like MFS transporter